MIKYKICIWENIASPHQSFFFKELSLNENIDLEVRYFEKFHEERLDLGWSDNNSLPINERYVVPNVNDALGTLSDWKERIHIIPGLSYQFTQDLLKEFLKNNIKWAHWSERSGSGLARKLNYNVNIFNFLQSIVSKIIKRDYAKKINKYAIGAFSQGDLAKKDFIDWGLKKEKIENLFYTIDELPLKDNFTLDENINTKDKRIFMYVGSLDERKGIKNLINSFSSINNAKDWILILVGHDKSNGEYQKLAKDLKLDKSIFFTGPKAISDVPNYISKSDVFILPTLFDGWGAVLNEACQIGKAIISTNECGAAMHIIKDKKNGIITKAGNRKSLKNAMQFFVDNPHKIKEYGDNSKDIYYNEFTPKKNVERFIKTITKWIKEENKT